MTLLSLLLSTIIYFFQDFLYHPYIPFLYNPATRGILLIYDPYVLLYYSSTANLRKEDEPLIVRLFEAFPMECTFHPR